MMTLPDRSNKILQNNYFVTFLLCARQVYHISSNFLFCHRAFKLIHVSVKCDAEVKTLTIHMKYHIMHIHIKAVTLL